ncbi:hypothetical protein K7X08_028447 [Anisodus acutangulus]|uniref:Uncharacterized protein n=1 Tax=Anisodus acutangulus TaxID=402998 RepID=A0A9Q1M933_9SOLA|nr:hypothetical protein K7X08_028447 [Anisodus acutangulus]
MKLPLLIVILLLHSHLLQVFSLFSRFLLLSANVVDEVVTIDKRGGVAASGRASAHGDSLGGQASHGRSGGSRKSPNTGTAGRNIPVYAGAAGAMNHHNFNRHRRNVGTTLNCICFSSLFFIICSILIMML